MIMVWCSVCKRLRAVKRIEPSMLRLDCGHDIKLGAAYEAGQG